MRNVGCIILWSTFVIVPAGSRGVVLWWGSVEKRIMNEGLNFKVPMAETVIKVDVRALAERFAPYATGLRDAIARAAEVEDAGSAALYTDLSRGVDQQLGILDAHLHR